VRVRCDAWRQALSPGVVHLHHFPLLSFSSLCEHIPSYIDILHLYTHQP